MATKPSLTVLERSQISPPSAAAHHQSLPLTFLDIAWLPYPPVHHLFFYESPLSKTEFVETTIPMLKHSLSVALQHFLPFAGNLIVFQASTTKPEIRYVAGDSVAFTSADATESRLDFNDLVGNHPRGCDKFYPLVPLLGTAVKVSDYLKVPVFSVQATFFPGSGVAIGITNHHCLGDARTRFCFMKTWTLMARSGADELVSSDGPFPFYDRVISYPDLDELYLSKYNLKAPTEEYQPACLVGPTDKVRATFVLTRPVIDQLKRRVSAELPELRHVSSFTVACAYVWSCVAQVRGDGLQVFGFTVDCRPRMDPPVPAAYFGNCVAPCIATTKNPDLSKDGGFLVGAELIGDVLYELVNDEDGILNNAGVWFDFAFGEVPTTAMGVAGTPKLKFYDADFGWGRTKKYETISIDYSGSISINTCRDSTQDLEIGLGLSPVEMEAFVGVFNQGLKQFLV